MIDIAKNVCPYCLEENTPLCDRPEIFASIPVGPQGRLYLCREHFLDFASAIKKFCEQENIEII